MKRRLIYFTLLGIFGFSIFLSFAYADIFIQSKRHTDSYTVMGKTHPAEDLVITQWLSKDKFRNDEGNKKSYIVRLDINKLYILNHEKKTYSVVDLPIDFSKILPPQAQQMMQMMKMSATVTDTGETRKIGKWNCRKYIVNLQGGMMNTNMEIWTTKDVKINYEAYEKFSESIMGLNPMFKNIVDEFKKIKGLPIYRASTISIMGSNIKSTEEVTEITEKSPPKGIYELPVGYKEVQFNPMERK
ncbi:DUF4412 domain-containing protein [SCandidatus Aminicenantes bacterium Aminicenantia_JdfR_composite]|jgi:hypothetical protein|nr:DUF4412 domain-containing protein [SCandidatus Aminicenantes bacterium Aminicenantia_JdfR_composite]